MNTLQSGLQIVETARRAKLEFGESYAKKYGGAIVVEILRQALHEEGIITSRRDVFVRGVPCEIDLIVPRMNAGPWMDLLYEPNQVLIALEVKKCGSFYAHGRDKIKNDCALLKATSIKYDYISFEDRENYKYRPTEDLCGCPCFNLAWHKQNDGPLEPTQDWEKLIAFLRKLIAGELTNAKTSALPCPT